VACPHHRAARNGRARRRVLAATGLSIVLGLSAACGSRSGSDANPALDPANELPFGNLDVPVAAAQVNAQILVGGWAMDDRGVREVRVYVDGRFASATELWRSPEGTITANSSPPTRHTTSVARTEPRRTSAT